MSNLVVDDAFLFKYIKNYENRQLSSLPNEYELNHRFSKRFERKMRALIKYEKQTPTMRKFVNYSKRVAAVFMVIVTVAFITTMSVEAYRVRLFHVITEIWEEFTSIIFQVDDHTVQKSFSPVKPLYIPNGFANIEEGMSETEYYIYFKNVEGTEIMYEQSQISTNAIITDTEDIVAATIQIANQSVTFFTNKGVHQLYWHDDDSVYTIMSAYDSQELILMAESIINKK